jgi:hypothetical protein
MMYSFFEICTIISSVHTPTMYSQMGGGGGGAKLLNFYCQHLVSLDVIWFIMCELHKVYTRKMNA